MDILKVKLAELEISVDSFEWLDMHGLSESTVGDLVSTIPDPYNDDDEKHNDVGEDLCHAIGYYIWSKNGWNK